MLVAIARERATAGIRTARGRGVPIGRPKRVFRRDEARRLRAAGLSWRKITQALDVPMATVIAACRELAAAPQTFDYLFAPRRNTVLFLYADVS